MSSIGSTPLETSILQASSAQQVASKAKDKERAATEQARRQQDLVDLSVAGVETSEAVRKLPRNDSEQAEAERDRDGDRGTAPPPDDGESPHVDVTA